MQFDKGYEGYTEPYIILFTWTRVGGQVKKSFSSSSQGEFTTPLPGPLNKPLHLDKPVNSTLAIKNRGPNIMTLLQSCLIDVLEPEADVFPYYEIFLSRYSLITVTAIVSQCSLMHETYEGMTKADMDNDIDRMIAELPIGAEEKRKLYPILNIGAGIDPGLSVQENEKRTFASELFSEDAKKYSLSNRELILRGLNSSAFLNYFFLIEDSLKNIYIDLVQPNNKFISGSETIQVCLKKIISELSIEDRFKSQLYERSKLFFDFESLELMWSLLNHIRNKIAHTNGFYDEKAKRSFNRRLENIAGHFNNNDLLLSINMILDVFSDHYQQIENTGNLVVDDALENIIRNISIFIMESLYICKMDEVANRDRTPHH